MDHNEENESSYLSFKDGLPTRPDVDLLIKTWPEPKVGDNFEYGAIEKLIGSEWASARFRTVTTSWRRRMLERGLVLESMPGSHFYVASADQITAATYGTLKFVGKKAHKQRRKLAAAKIETEQQRSVIEHQARLMLAVERDTKKHRMNVLPNTAAKEPVAKLPSMKAQSL